MNAVERVKSICKERKIPISKLEADCGFSNGYIGQLRKGTFPDDRLRKIAKYLNLSPDFIATGEEVELKGKSEYIFINVLEYISFDVTNAHGRSIVTTINKEECGYHDTIKDGDELEIFWE